MNTAAATYTFKVIRDCGYGRVWTRLAKDRADAERTVREWQNEGRTDGLVNGGDWFICPVTEVPNGLGGYHYDHAGPMRRFEGI
jgi:hypothetical protein